MSIFDQILQGVLVGGAILGPVFIHSQHGVVVLNASENTVATILQAHQQATGTQQQNAQTVTVTTTAAK